MTTYGAPLARTKDRYSDVPDVVMLDTRNHNQWNIDCHAVHDVISNACWQVEHFVRAYALTTTKTLGFILMFDALIADSKVPAPSLTPQLQAKRTMDYVARYDRPEKLPLLQNIDASEATESASRQ
ncbi:hypothetical protein OC845_005235 [Tilletia horrida]|nr:hypothetical protein OC845_005235 [Tilletia horrida]